MEMKTTLVTRRSLIGLIHFLKENSIFVSIAYVKVQITWEDHIHLEKNCSTLYDVTKGQ